MSKNTNFEEEIIFFDAEIIEDDGDEDIPMGVLVNAPAKEDEAVEESQPEMVEDVVADNVAEETPVAEDAPVANEEVAPAKEEPTPKKAPEKKPATPSKPKISTAPKKQVSEADIWGVAVINTKKPKQETPVEEPKAEEKKPAPRKKAEPKTEPQTEVKKPAQKSTTKPVKKADTTPAPNAEPKTPTTKNTKKTSEEELKVTKEAKVEETIIQEGTREYHGKFVIKKTDKGHFVYKLFAYGNKCVAIGAQAYEGLSGVKGGIASVSKIAGTAPIENQTLKSYETLKFPKWEIYADKKGEFRLRLYASNGNLVATTNDGYLSVQAAKKGIESVAKAADGAAIVRNDNAW